MKNQNPHLTTMNALFSLIDTEDEKLDDFLHEVKREDEALNIYKRNGDIHLYPFAG